MPLRANHVREHVATVVIDVFGEKLNVQYRPGVLTRAFFKRVDAIGSNVDIEGLSEQEAEAALEPARKEMSEALGELLVSWDYLDDDGKPLPINGETFEKHVPQILSDRLWAAIRKDQEVPKA